jgi:quinohemoprotein ethanol dehydrogenase
MAAPMTHEIDGIQYLAVMAGYGGGQIGDPLPENAAAFRYGNEGRIIARAVMSSGRACCPISGA